MYFYLAIILFISSVVGGIISLFVLKNISRTKILIGCAVHFILILIYLFSRFATTHKDLDSSDYSITFLLTVCSGIILCGMVFQAKVSVLFKVYFSLFVLTLPMFFFSPSRLVNFLLTTKYADTTGRIFPIEGNYFLEEQSAFIKNDSIAPTYKLIKKQGMFHQTIQRNVSFAGRLDSIQVLEFDTGEKVLVRGYSGHITFVSATIDSIDVTIKLVKDSKNQIERRL